MGKVNYGENIVSWMAMMTTGFAKANESCWETAVVVTCNF